MGELWGKERSFTGTAVHLCPAIAALLLYLRVVAPALQVGGLGFESPWLHQERHPLLHPDLGAEQGVSVVRHLPCDGVPSRRPPFGAELLRRLQSSPPVHRPVDSYTDVFPQVRVEIPTCVHRPVDE